MMIEYRQGDFLDAPESFLLHGCNAAGGFGRGAALMVRNRFPFAYHAYRQAYERKELVLGTVIWAIDLAVGKIIGNAITQAHWRNPGNHRMVDYDAVRASMKATNDFVCIMQNMAVSDLDCSAVAMPMIGAGLGGGDWSTIARLIEEESTMFRPIVYRLVAADSC